MTLRLFAAFAALIGSTACSNLPGRPRPGPEVVRPEEVLDFKTLYQENCSGCHGPNGEGNASIALNNPVYLSIADDSNIRTVIARGVRGTQMPPFAKSAGGSLTDQQVEALVRGIRAWARPDELRGVSLPSYVAASPGDPKRGAEVYATFCSSCHGPNGEGAKGGSAIANGTYLALVSDQYLRTIVITGRPDLGAPDWRANVKGRPMSEQEIGDVVAWLVSRRAQYPGQPYGHPGS